jgi:hypothetical protein
MVCVELYTVMPVIICESFHDMHCFKLAKFIPQFCLDLFHVFKSLSLQSHLKFCANKDHVANLVRKKGEEQSFYFLAGNSGRDKAE